VAVEKSASLVLRCQDWSETSQVVHLLARDAGRFRCLAKGAKRPKNAFGGPLDRWTLGEAVFSLRDPNQLAVLMEFYETERFEGLRRRLDAYYAASLVTELVTGLTADLDPQPEVFDLSVQTLGLLVDAEDAACRAVAYAFGWRLLGLLGYGPDMGHCVECRRPIEADRPVAFSAGLGGLVCQHCRPSAGLSAEAHWAKADAVALGPKALQAVRFLLGAPLDQLPRARLSEATSREVRTALVRRVTELAGKEPLAAKYV